MATGRYWTWIQSGAHLKHYYLCSHTNKTPKRCCWDHTVLVLGSSVTRYCRFTSLLCKKGFAGIILWNVAPHRPACSSLFVLESLLSLAVFCSLANCSKKLVLDFMGEMGRWTYQATLLIVSVILSFSYLLKSLSYAYKWILIAGLNGKWKWETYCIIWRLCRAGSSHAYLCTSEPLLYLAR